MSATAVQEKEPETLTSRDSSPLFQDTLTPEEILELGKEIVRTEEFKEKTREVFENFDQYEDSFTDSRKASTRKSTLAWLLNQPQDAVILLEEVDPDEEGLFIEGLAHSDLQEEHLAVERFETLYENLQEENEEFPEKVFLYYIEALLKLDQLEKAEEQLEEVEQDFDDSPDLLYLDGFLTELKGDLEQAFQRYEEALELDSEHVRTLFRKAKLLQIHAESVEDSDQSPEELAKEIYEKIMNITPAHEGPILNLGVLYEDEGDFHRAKDCYKLILEDQPNHSVAEMYMEDAQASLNLSYNEERLRQQMQKSRLLNRNVSEFEFSQRIQTAFDQLRIETIGDLLQCTEQELLSCENFGKLSLKRLRNFLDSKGLSLARKGRKRVTLKPSPPPEDTDDIMKKPVEEFDWSARSQRAMKRLSVFTVNDLVEKTEEELLDCQNFGETSLQEVKDTLNELGLSLKDSGEE